jgi:hypothetical protein
MSRECWHLRSKRVWLSASQGRRHFQSAISPDAHFEQVCVQHFETAGRQFKSAGISRTQASY